MTAAGSGAIGCDSEVVDLCRALIQIDTTNPPGGETAAAMLLRDYLEPAGVECEIVARDPLRANLVARLRGSGGTGRTHRSTRSSTTTAISSAAAPST